MLLVVKRKCCLNKDSSYFCRFEKCWKEELAKHGEEKASVARAIIKMEYKRLIAAITFVIMYCACSFLGPVTTHLSTLPSIFFSKPI